MLQVARLSPKQLGDSSKLVENFLRSQLRSDGAFANRSGDADLYYTVFGLEGLIALGAEAPAQSVSTYLRSFGKGDGLDLVHLSCLIRCWSNLSRTSIPLDADALQARIESFRSQDGGYNTVPDEPEGTAYGCFMAAAAYQDLRREMPDPAGLGRCLQSLKSDDGGYSNQAGLPMGLTPTTAAAATLLRRLGESESPGLSAWLLSRCHPEGGFFAAPAAPIPDLLSTATALHALSGLHAPLDQVREPCLDFIDSLWTSAGGFYGNWTDDALDCEYTYYGLLALGHLSL
jgi:prenyltransferase beta subunit